MPIYIQDSTPAPAYFGQVSSTMGSFTTSLTGTSDTQPDVDGSFNRALDKFTCSFKNLLWPSNGWALQGGYMISSASQQLVNEPDLTYNSEKDILIPQMIGWYPGIVETYTGFYKNVKDKNPSIKILPYQSPTVMAKLDTGNASGPDWFHDLVNGSDGHETWIAREATGGYVQSSFNANNYRTNVCDQFTTKNSTGRSFSQQTAFDVEAQASTVNVNGAMLDYIDGIYWDVIPPAPELAYEDGTVPRVQVQFDWDRDGSSDPRSDETDGGGVEANYGGVRMWRRGMASWVDSFTTEFGPNFVISRNGSRDGIDYSGAINVLGDGDPLEDSEFYQKWGHSIFETMQNGLGIKRNTSTNVYDITFGGFAQQCRHSIRIKQSLIPAGTHPWGKYGANSVLAEFQILNRTWIDVDYDIARFIGGFCAVNGMCLGLSVGKIAPFPPLDEYIFEWGDTVNVFGGSNGDSASMGTYDASVSPADVNADWTQRSPDFESGIADFYWQEFDNVIWVVRSDYASGNDYGYGTGVNCELPDPGSGKKWIHPDLSNYNHPTSGFFTRGQNNTLNSGNDVTAGGSYGVVNLKPAHAAMLQRTDV